MSNFLALAFAVLASSVSARAGDSVVPVDAFGRVPGNQSFHRATDAFLSLTTSPLPGVAFADGAYVFQITDLAGAKLLTPDPIAQRSLTIAGGRIASYLGSLRATCPCTATGGSLVQLAPFLQTPAGDGNYLLWLTPVRSFDPRGGFFGFDPRASVTASFHVDSGGRPEAPTLITGYAFFDNDESGTWNPLANPLELPLAGWRVELTGQSTNPPVTFTDANGRYQFLTDAGLAFVIVEKAPGGFIGDNVPGAIWLATTPRAVPIFTSGSSMPGPDFGNLSFEPAVGSGRTKGFWSNNNGAALLAACDPDWRDVLTTRNGAPVSLRRPISSDDPNVSVFAPLAQPASFQAAFADWKDYIVGDPAGGHGGFILSSQIAASMLSSACGFMQFNAYIDRFQNGVLVSYSSMLDGALGLLNQPGAGLTGPNDPYQTLRDQMLSCVNEFGSINNSGDPTQPQVVYRGASVPAFFVSPY